MNLNEPNNATYTGRQASSRNAIKHGLCSESTLIVKGENIEDFKALEATWFNAYRPQDAAETHLVHQLAQADWFFQRANRTVAAVEAELYNGPNDPSNWTEDQHLKLSRMTRYQTTRANAVAKVRKARHLQGEKQTRALSRGSHPK